MSSASFFGYVPSLENTQNNKLPPRVKMGLPFWKKVGYNFTYFCSSLAGNSLFKTLTTLLSLYALFGNDIRLAWMDESVDYSFNVMTFVCIGIFSVEVLVNCIGRVGYFPNFYFWLDLISTISLVLDISTVSEGLFSSTVTITGMVEGIESQSADSPAGGGAGSSTFAKLGGKAGRIVRVFRLIRLIRVVKIYKAWMHARRKEELDKEEADLIASSQEGLGGFEVEIPGNGNVAGNNVYEQEIRAARQKNLLADIPENGEPRTRLGKKLTEKITQKLIVLVIIMLLVLPIFSVSESEVGGASSIQFYSDDLSRQMNEYISSCIVNGKSDDRSIGLRKGYERKLVELIYFYNPNAEISCHGQSGCIDQVLDELVWLAYSVPASYLESIAAGSPDSLECVQHPELEILKASENFSGFDKRFNGATFSSITGELSSNVISMISTTWKSDKACENDPIYGVTTPGSPSVFYIPLSTPCPSMNLRYNERSVTFPYLQDERKNPTFVPVLSKRREIQWTSKLSILQTIFVIFVLGLGVMAFTESTNRLVLVPIERTLAKMEKIRQTPLAAAGLGEEEYRKDIVQRKKVSDWDAQNWYQKLYNRIILGKRRPVVDGGDVDSMMETAILEKTIVRIGTLLVLGFGEAGTEIIAKNMEGGEGAVNVLIPGRTMEAIFGFIAIRDFSEVTEVLQDRVMIFVNQIAEIVHGIVDEFNGAANKNLGFGYFVVWRLANQKNKQRLCDLSILSVMKIIAAVNRSPILAEYRSHPGLLQRFPNYRVRLGFGMHVGVAIEGAIGSEFKIDASYIGPNVAIAERLQRIGRIYHTLVVLSGQLVDCCSHKIVQVTRKIDTVVFDGNRKVPISLFTIDLDVYAVDVAEPKKKQWLGGGLLQRGHTMLKRGETRREIGSRRNIKMGRAMAVARAGMVRYKLKEERMNRKFQKLDESYDLMKQLNSAEISKLRAIYSNKNGILFKALFLKGILNYESGEWVVASEALQKTRDFWLQSGGKVDGPSQALLELMEDMKSPGKGWKGYRLISESMHQIQDDSNTHGNSITSASH